MLYVVQLNYLALFIMQNARAAKVDNKKTFI